jgi:hypothetical protein
MIARTFGVMVIADLVVETIMVRTQLISYDCPNPKLPIARRSSPTNRIDPRLAR